MIRWYPRLPTFTRPTVRGTKLRLENGRESMPSKDHQLLLLSLVSIDLAACGLYITMFKSPLPLVVPTQGVWRLRALGEIRG